MYMNTAKVIEHSSASNIVDEQSTYVLSSVLEYILIQINEILGTLNST